MNLFLMKLRYVWKTLTAPASTVYEMGWGTPNQRRVSRFEYLHHTLKIMR